jgi:hypothetical protein
MKLFRQGDIYIAAVDKLPANAVERASRVLVHGEITGHSHRLEDGALAQVYEADEVLYVRVAEVARVVHEEHGAIALEPGIYKVWRQREYLPRSFRLVAD